MKHCKNQFTMLITQYCCKIRSNRMLEHRISGPLTKVIETISQWFCVDAHEDLIRKSVFCGDVTSFAGLMLQ